MAWYLTSAFKPDKPVKYIKPMYNGGYALIQYKDSSGAQRQHSVPHDMLIEKKDILDDLL